MQNVLCSLSVVFLGEETDKSLGEISSHAISNKVRKFLLAHLIYLNFLLRFGNRLK